jgi:hypothetical protein
MIVRLIENFGDLEKGHSYDVSIELAKDLIKQGYAVIHRENTKDKKATDALNAARVKDDK